MFWEKKTKNKFTKKNNKFNHHLFYYMNHSIHIHVRHNHHNDSFHIHIDTHIIEFTSNLFNSEQPNVSELNEYICNIISSAVGLKVKSSSNMHF